MREIAIKRCVRRQHQSSQNFDTTESTMGENGAAEGSYARSNEIEDVASFHCERCGKRCKSRFCTNNAAETEVEEADEVGRPPPNGVHQIDEWYEKIVYWRRNLFLLPNGAAGKSFIRETTTLMNAWLENSPLKDCVMKAIHIMPALLLQKPSKTSKSQDQVKALERRMVKWNKGDFISLQNEADAIQSRIPKNNGRRSIDTISKKFKELIEKGNVNSAIKIITNNMSNGVLPLNDHTLDLLHVKHPQAEHVNEVAALQGPALTVEPIIYDVIDETMILKAAQMTKGGSGPSGLDADGWKKILTSKVDGESGKDLRVTSAKVVKKMCVQVINDNSLEALLASRLVPLNKNPGLSPIGVGEVLRRIAGKVVMSVTKKDVVAASTKAQMCGRKGGSEAAIHAMKDMFDNNQSDAVLLVDAANAFNRVNRKVLLHNIYILCPMIATFVHNCYIMSARLFVIGGVEIRSQEGTTQGDPLGMAIYALAITPLLDMMAVTMNNSHNKMVSFADDLTSSGEVKASREWWDHLIKLAPYFGYYPQP